MAVGAAPDPVVVGVRAGEDGVSVGGDAVRSGPVTPDGSFEPEAAGRAVAVAGAGATVAVGAAPDTGVDAVPPGPVTPDGSSEPQAASAAVRASARTTLNRVMYLVVRVRVIFFTFQF